MANKYKIYCLTEDTIVYGYTTNAVSEICPNNEAHSVKANSLAQINIKVYPYNISNDGVSSTSYMDIASIIFHGANVIGKIDKIFIIGSTTAGSFSVRIIDTTNDNNIIAETIENNNTIDTMIDMGILSNISTGISLWKLQVKASNILAVVNISFLEMTTE